MTPDEMLDHAFGGPDDATRERLGREAAADPALDARLRAVRRSLDLLLDDGDDPAPPPDLARRTVAFVAAHRRRRGLPDLAPVTVPFRWVDLAVAASIFLAGLITLLPAAHRARLQSGQVLCSLNLGQLGRGLAHYALQHGSYPYPGRDCPAPYAALYKVMLNDAGEIGDPTLLDCPGGGHAARKQPLPSYAAFCSMSKTDPKGFAQLLDGDYAYQLGHRRPSGQPSHAEPLAARVPLLSDQPPYDASGRILAGNSPNHRGAGQNVAFSDGHVGWYPTRAIGPGDRDMFLNERRRPEPGLHPADAVLAPGTVRFFGGR